MLTKIRAYIEILRMRHYVKNLLIFIPYVFSYGKFENEKALFFRVCLGVIFFSMASSLVYIFNDINDKEKDRLHPVKCKRPLACGKISVREAFGEGGVLLTFILFGIIYFWEYGYYSILLYLGLNVLYTCWFKKAPIFDVISLSCCYLIRVLFGCQLLGVKMSNWLYLTALSFSLYVSVEKRAGEILVAEKTGETARNVLTDYSVGFLKSVRDVCLSLTIVFYSLWCTSPGIALRFHSEAIRVSTIFVIAILLRYHLDIFKNLEGEPVDIFYHDIVLMLLIVLFFGFIFLCMIGIL